MTRRYATNVIVAITAKPLRLQLPHRHFQPCGAAICASRAQRSVDATDTPFLSLNLDPDAPEARLLETLPPERGVVLVDRGRLTDWDSMMSLMLNGQLNGEQARQLSDGLIFALTGKRPAGAPIDPRVRLVAEFLKMTLPTDIETERLATMTGLSATRLVHLFSQQIGMPMSSFLLWAKMRHALGLIQSGQSLTEIAQACGFADSPHLTRTFQSFYAVKPSMVADSRYVQVRLC